MKTFSFICACL